MLGPLEGRTAGLTLAQHTLGFGRASNITATPTVGSECHPSAHPPNFTPALSPSAHRGLAERAVGEDRELQTWSPKPMLPPPATSAERLNVCFQTRTCGQTWLQPWGVSWEHQAAPHQWWPQELQAPIPAAHPNCTPLPGTHHRTTADAQPVL